MGAETEAMAYLHAHGLEAMEPKALNASLRSAIARLKALYERARLAMPPYPVLNRMFSDPAARRKATLRSDRPSLTAPA